jgi:heme/copper-type cytochrome/quinol oxidase subunit 2
MTLDKNFGEDILHKIEDEKLHPKPRWQFLLKDYVVWGVGVLALLLGAMAMSLIFYMSNYQDLDVYGRAGGQPLEELFLIVPFFWIICLALFVFIVLYNIKHTKKGYRYPLPIMLALIIGASVLLGGIFYFVGFGEKVDDELGRRAPFYDRVINPHVDFWSQPEKGRLMGMIVSQTNDNEYILVDRASGQWYIFTANAKQLPGAKIEIGRPVRLLGKIETEHKFKVAEVLAMTPGKGFFEHLGPPMQPPLLEPMPGRLNARGQQCQTGDDFNFLLNKYPQVKTIFENDLLKYKDQIKVIIKQDPEFIKHLETLDISSDTINQLLP